MAHSPNRTLPTLNLGLLYLHNAQPKEASRWLSSACLLSCTDVKSLDICGPAIQGLASSLALVEDNEQSLRSFLFCARLLHSSPSSSIRVECLMSAASIDSEMKRYDESLRLWMAACRNILAGNSSSPSMEDRRAGICSLELALLAQMLAEWDLERVMRDRSQRVLRESISHASHQLPSKSVNAILFLGVSEDLDVSVMRRLSSESDKDLAKQDLEWRERIVFTGNFQRLRRQSRLKVVYMSSDFGQTVMLSFMAHAIALHGNKTSTDSLHITCLSLNGGGHEQSPWRRLIQSSAVGLQEMEDRDDSEVARWINEQQVGLVVYLDGHNHGNRMSVLRRKPAPLQVSYRFCTTTGSSFISHYIGDRVMSPVEYADSFFSEKMVYLPGSYLANTLKVKFPDVPAQEVEDRRQERRDARRRHDVPLDSIVLACFNRIQKIDEVTFETWMRILEQESRTVLWLIEFPKEAQRRINQHASRRGVDPRRLIWSPMAAEEEFMHMAAAADLFLDTPRCNAHTTASYSLWASTPVLTLSLLRPVARVGSSLSLAAGPQAAAFIARNLEDYASLMRVAIKQRTSLELVRERSLERRQRRELFDVAAWVRGMETSFRLLGEVAAARGFPGEEESHPHLVISSQLHEETSEREGGGEAGRKAVPSPSSPHIGSRRGRSE